MEKTILWAHPYSPLSLDSSFQSQEVLLCVFSSGNYAILEPWSEVVRPCILKLSFLYRNLKPSLAQQGAWRSGLGYGEWALGTVGPAASTPDLALIFQNFSFFLLLPNLVPTFHPLLNPLLCHDCSFSSSSISLLCYFLFFLPLCFSSQQRLG